MIYAGLIVYVDLENDKFFFNPAHVYVNPHIDYSAFTVEFDPSTFDRMKHVGVCAGSFLSTPSVAGAMISPILARNYTPDSIRSYLHNISMCKPSSIDRTYNIKMEQGAQDVTGVGGLDAGGLYMTSRDLPMDVLHRMAESFAMIRNGIASLNMGPCSICYPSFKHQARPASPAIHHIPSVSVPRSNPRVMFQLTASGFSRHDPPGRPPHEVEYWTYHDAQLSVDIEIECNQEEG